MAEEKKITNFTLPILVVLLAVAAFFAGAFFTKIQYLEKGKVQPTQVTPTSAPASPLSVENLKKYALELGLNTKEFNECLDKGTHQENVKDDFSYGGSLGVAGTPAFFINGRLLGGAFPFESFKEIIDKELEGKGSDKVTAYSSALQEAATRGAFKPKAVEVKIKEKDPVKGPEGAKVTIVEFSDFQCPFCARASATVKQVLETYKDQVRLVYKQFPLTSLHPFAQKAAEASLCAQDQGKFWEYHDKLFQVQGQEQ